MSHLNNCKALVCSERNTSFILESPCENGNCGIRKHHQRAVEQIIYEDTRLGPSTKNETTERKDTNLILRVFSNQELHDFQNLPQHKLNVYPPLYPYIAS